MLLHNLMEQIKQNCLIDDELRLFIYDDYIEVIDHTDYEYISPKLKKLMKEEFNAMIFRIHYSGVNKEITAIEPTTSNILFTPANRDMYKFLVDLPGQTIDDLESYPTNPGRKDDIYQSL